MAQTHISLRNKIDLMNGQIKSVGRGGELWAFPCESCNFKRPKFENGILPIGKISYDER